MGRNSCHAFQHRLREQRMIDLIGDGCESDVIGIEDDCHFCKVCEFKNSWFSRVREHFKDAVRMERNEYRDSRERLQRAADIQSLTSEVLETAPHLAPIATKLEKPTRGPHLRASYQKRGRPPKENTRAGTRAKSLENKVCSNA
jgi:hypothetical protein